MQRSGGGISPPTAEEREVLMGFARFHTVPACPSGDYSRRKSETEMVRISLLGNSFHAEAVAWLISHWGLAAGYHQAITTIESLRAEADAYDPINVGAGAPRQGIPTLRPPREGAERGLTQEEEIAIELTRRADHRGIDLRMGATTQAVPSAWPRAGLEPM